MIQDNASPTPQDAPTPQDKDAPQGAPTPQATDSTHTAAGPRARLHRLARALTPHPLSARAVIWWIMAVIYFKLLYFDLLWSLDSTFSGFQFPLGYITKLGFAALLTLPVLALRSRWYVGVMALVLDLWLMANLMYFRTYYTIIPATSYGLVGNLADFTDSVWESLRWADAVLPLSTAVLLAALWRTPLASVLGAVARRLARWLLLLFLAPLVITLVWIAIKGGYKKAYEDLMYDFPTCGAAVYTIPGAMIYEFMRGQIEFTPELQARVNQYLARRPGADYTPPEVQARPSTIILLLESFESWPIGMKIDGQEVTPNLNALLADSTGVFYAPQMLTQVGGARSIDAQLIMHTGLLPVSYGAFSYRFIHNTYPSLDKAWKERYGAGARALGFTVDKKTVWNVAVVAQDFGYELLDKPNFVLDVKTGPRGRLGDDSFLRQAYEKIADSDDLWPRGGHVLLQLVTYSGHTPFVIPDNLKRLKIKKKLPERLANYLQVCAYTDAAVGQFVRRVRANPKLAESMIVITGDHEGMGAPRADYRRDPEVAQWMSAGQYTPLIVLNSPVTGHYDGVFGQVDMYPTLLDLMGLDYAWRGLGQSLLDPSRLPYAVDARGQVVGDASQATPGQVEHRRQARQIADTIIASDFFKHAPIER